MTGSTITDRRWVYALVRAVTKEGGVFSKECLGMAETTRPVGGRCSARRSNCLMPRSPWRWWMTTGRLVYFARMDPVILRWW